MSTTRDETTLQAPMLCRLLPKELLSLPLSRLLGDAQQAEQLAGRLLLTVGDLLTDAAEGLDEASAGAIRAALARALRDGLRQFTTAVGGDLATVRAQLLGPLDDADRTWLGEILGLDGAPPTRPELARQRGVSIGELDQRIDRLRELLHERCSELVAALRLEVGREMVTFDGVLHADHAAAGTLLHLLASEAADAELGLRLAAFCLPGDVHLHRGVLYGTPPRRYRQLLRVLPSLVPQHRLPLPLDGLVAELRAQGLDVPRGVLQHVLRRELHVAIAIDATLGEIAAPDPLRPDARLVEILLETGVAMQVTDLRFAYRERFRFASETTLRRHLQRSDNFVQLGPETWSLRRWHTQQLADVAPIVDRVARRLCADGGRHHVAALLNDVDDELTLYLVLDRLAADPRVRMLGRGDACAVSHQQSRVMEQLLQAFRCAAGEVVASLFLSNQKPQQRRLIERLLHENRLFVRPADDRIDTLSNYPFNAERMRRLLTLVRQELQTRAGYATATALKVAVDHTDLGGEWLTPMLLADLLRRNGSFEVLPGDLVACGELGLGASVLRQARQALREAGEPITVGELLRARPELAEFASCLGELLDDDPLVQSADGRCFTLR